MHFHSIIDNFPGKSILVLGETFLDVYHHGYSERICREAPVPIVDITATTYAPGGAANAATNIAALGGTVFFLSVVGDDTHGKRAIQMLAKKGVITSNCIVDLQRETIAKKRILAGDQILIRYDSGTVKPLNPTSEASIIDRLIHLWMNVNTVIISDYGYGIITDEVIRTIKQLQTKLPRILLIDSKHLDRFYETHPTVVKPNYKEAIALLGITKTERGEKRISQIYEYRELLLKKTNATIAAVTLDAQGALIFDQNGSTYRTYTDQIENPKGIGAGDTYIAALALALTAGAEIKSAAEIATHATKVIITKQGTAYCTRAELRASLSKTDKIIVNRASLREIVEQFKTHRKKIVFTNGCFDILHSGHVKYLNRAKACGDILILGINTDQSIRTVKGNDRPINTLEDRIRVLAALSSVDYIVPMPETTAEHLVHVIKPDIYVKGGDYTLATLPEANIVKAYGGVVTFIPLVKGKSTTNIIHRIQRQQTTKQQVVPPL